MTFGFADRLAVDTGHAPDKFDFRLSAKLAEEPRQFLRQHVIGNKLIDVFDKAGRYGKRRDQGQRNCGEGHQREYRNEREARRKLEAAVFVEASRDLRREPPASPEPAWLVHLILLYEGSPIIAARRCVSSYGKPPWRHTDNWTMDERIIQ